MTPRKTEPKQTNSRIVAHLRNIGPATAGELARSVGLTVEGVRAELRRLGKLGHIDVIDETIRESSRGVKAKVWAIKGTPRVARPPEPAKVSTPHHADIVRQALAAQPPLFRAWVTA